jgi:hypothetical protein
MRILHFSDASSSADLRKQDTCFRQEVFALLQEVSILFSIAASRKNTPPANNRGSAMHVLFKQVKLSKWPADLEARAPAIR